MTIKQHGGVFGRNPTFNNVDVDGTLTVDGSLVINGSSMAPVYKGTWNASTNTPTLASSVGTLGNFYIVSVAGSTDLDGITNWAVGDWALFNGSTWQRVEGGASGNFVNLTATGTSTLGNLQISSNTVSSTNTNGNIDLTPNGTGEVNVSKIDVAAGEIDGTAIGANSASSGSFTTLSASSTVTLSGGTANGVLYLDGSKVATSGTDLVFNATGLGIGTSSPSAKLSVKTTGAQVDISTSATDVTFESIDRSATSNAIDTRFYTRLGTFQWYNGQYTERMRLDASGNLGLGVTPSAWSIGKAQEIETVGNAIWSTSANDLRLLANIYYNGGYKYATTASASMYQVSGGTHTWYTAPSGTADNAISFTQAMTLDASGNLALGSTSTSNARIFSYINDAALPSIIARQDGAAPIQTWQGASGAERARITSGGDFHVARLTTADTTVGVSLFESGTITAARSSSVDADLNLYVYSTGAAAARFYVGMGGTVYATNTTISAISDQRFKENICDLDVGLNAIMALKPRKFDWKDGKGKNIKGDRGFIAQEIEQVFPDLVDQWADPAPEGEDPYKSVRQDLIPVLVKAIQELNAKVQALEAQLNGA